MVEMAKKKELTPKHRAAQERLRLEAANHYAQQMAEHAEHARKKEDYLARLEAMPIPKEREEIKAKTEGFRLRKYYHCEICFATINYDDHGKCRKCRTNVSRCLDSRKCRNQNIAINTHTVGSRKIDEVINSLAGPFGLDVYPDESSASGIAQGSVGEGGRVGNN